MFRAEEQAKQETDVKQAEELICLYVVDPVMFNFSFLSDIF
jgi:hypothetical protein